METLHVARLEGVHREATVAAADLAAEVGCTAFAVEVEAVVAAAEAEGAAAESSLEIVQAGLPAVAVAAAAGVVAQLESTVRSVRVWVVVARLRRPAKTEALRDHKAVALGCTAGVAVLEEGLAGEPIGEVAGLHSLLKAVLPAEKFQGPFLPC